LAQKEESCVMMVLLTGGIEKKSNAVQKANGTMIQFAEVSRLYTEVKYK
jgi:hypothetical protein